MAHDKTYGICENKCKVEVYSKQNADDNFATKTSLNNYALKNHATNQTTYGVGSSTQYGHVMLSTDTSRAALTLVGAALDGSMGYRLSNSINSVRNSVNDVNNRVTNEAARIDNELDEIRDDIDGLRVEDTGWLDELSGAFELTKGVAEPATTGRGEPQIRKIGNHVMIRGTVKLTASSSSAVTILTVSEEYRPSAHEYYMTACTGQRIARIFMNASGELKLDFALNVSDGSKYAGELSWLDIKMDYYVD